MARNQPKVMKRSLSISMYDERYHVFPHNCIPTNYSAKAKRAE